MGEPTWQESLNLLRERTSVPAALGNAATLAEARHRWQHQLIARTSMHDLLFTLPGDDFPFSAFVRVHWHGGTSNIQRWRNQTQVEQVAAPVGAVFLELDSVLERLVDRPICRRCGLPVVVSAEQFEVFEHMHYVCFHYDFEHWRHDVDEECTAGGCPSASIAPAGHPEEARDSLVEELIDALMASELAQQSVDVRLDRRGPGVVLARFDDNAYLVTVRTDPERGE